MFYFGAVAEVHKTRLSDLASVFQAELEALRQALEWCRGHGETHTPYHIYSDSLSSLHALADPQSTDATVKVIRKVFWEVAAIQRVYLHWIKAHVGFPGNEEADKQAKEAIQLPEPSVTPGTSLSGLRRNLRRSAMALWTTRWETSEKGRTTHGFFPIPSTERFTCDANAICMLTDHGHLPVY